MTGHHPPVAEDLGSAAQRDRRKRILDASVALAAKGGYDAVQMRAVAQRAGVALATLYRYFPSKISLLVSALARELERDQERSERAVIPGATAYDRLMFVLARITTSLQRDPLLTEAMTRAYMFADATAAAEVEQVSRRTDLLFVRAMLGTDASPSPEQLAIARVISDAWLAHLVAGVTRRESGAEVTERLELAISLLLGVRNGADAF